MDLSSLDLSDETIPETNGEARAIFPEKFFNDYAPGTTDEKDFSGGSSDDYVPETNEEAEANAESKAEAREENPEIDQDMEGLIADVTNNEEVELKKPTRKRKTETHIWMQNIRQKKRQSGKAFLSKKGKLLKERLPKSVNCKCRHKCIEQINNEERISINAEFWEF